MLIDASLYVCGAENEMKEKLYTIPINDAFHEDCECPICAMYRKLEEDAIGSTMSGYMVEERRLESDQVGFCEKHVHMLYEQGDRLGLALMMKTHMNLVISKLEKYQQVPIRKTSLFSKKVEEPKPGMYVDQLNQSCYVCEKINRLFVRYIETVFYLYKKEEDFSKLFASSKGFCTKHYGMLYQEASIRLTGKFQEEFINVLNRIYLENMKRVRDDLSWFIDKFDYRFKDEPWKNAKDALPRAIEKMMK